MSDSLGGNAKTLMFVNISPASSNEEETVGSLGYATRASLIKNQVKSTYYTPYRLSELGGGLLLMLTSSTVYSVHEHASEAHQLVGSSCSRILARASTGLSTCTPAARSVK